MGGDESADSEGECARGNSDFQWAQFDPEAYFHHYYGDPHPDDDRVTELAAKALNLFGSQGNKIDVVDVGTGPNLIPFLAALPTAKKLTAWEYSPANITWLNGELRRSDLRPQWQHFWNVVRTSLGDNELPDNPMSRLKENAEVVQGSIFDLPAARWDAATMFFCAESITQRRDEFEAACARFAGCVKPGGVLAAAFLVRSEGYDVSGRRFPALKLSPEEIQSVFSHLARDLQVERIGLVEEEVRSGYTGALFLTAKR